MIGGPLEQSLRPPGFPFSEREFLVFKKRIAESVIQGKHSDIYGSWALRGIPREELFPTVAVAVFPTPAQTSKGYIFDSEYVLMDKPLRSESDYWSDVLGLNLTPRIQRMDAENFNHDERNYIRLRYLFAQLARSFMPIGIVLFGITSSTFEESAYLIGPKMFPRSMIMEQVKREAYIRLHPQ